jgi:hypothetical protein
METKRSGRVAPRGFLWGGDMRGPNQARLTLGHFSLGCPAAEGLEIPAGGASPLP